MVLREVGVAAMGPHVEQSWVYKSVQSDVLCLEKPEKRALRSMVAGTPDTSNVRGWCAAVVRHWTQAVPRASAAFFTIASFM